MAEEANTDSWIPPQLSAASNGDPGERSGNVEPASSRSSAGGAGSEGPPDSERPRPEPRRASGAAGGRDGQQVSAPSLGPNTVIEREPVEERLARHEQSEVDAMGLEKRRGVVGQSYGPSKSRQLVVYVGFVAIVAAVVVGAIILVSALDTGVGKNVPNNAPWAQPGVKQVQPKKIQ